MHAFSAVSTLFSFISLFLFSLLFLFQFSLFLALVTIPHVFYGYCSYLYWFQPVGFLYFTPIAHQPFLFAMSALSELPTSSIVVRPPLHLDLTSAFSLFYYLFHDKSLSIWFCHGSISLILMGKALSFSLPISMVCIKWSDPFTTYFEQRYFSSKALPKRGIG